MKRKKLFILLVVLVVIAGGAGGVYYYLQQRKKPNQPFVDAFRMRQNTVVATRGNIATYISSSGTLEPAANVTVAAETSGEIKELLVKKNDVVKEGDLLAVLENEQAELDYIIAKRDYEAALIDGDEITIRQKAIQLKNAELALQRTEIRAPISGTIVEVHVDDKDRVASGTSIVQIVDMQNFKINLRISELEISDIKQDQNVIVTVSSLGNQTYPAKITNVGVLPVGQGDPVTYPVEVRLSASDDRLRPGMNCNIDIVTAQATDVVVVPVESVNRVGGRSYVTVVDGDDTKVVEVQLGLSDGLNVAVLSGLEPYTTILRTNYSLYIDAAAELVGETQPQPGQSQNRGAPAVGVPQVQFRSITGGRF
ncbi:MAG: efflux RND transporter periplasmic adaptor subunit [Bacillota bacterium]|jgi:HlyD family secretion protein|nr:efflux RND transporter periplasmic adaptor subunit [Bacillota bacterium]HOA90959.1 efflux RND transporter periplasmic adaptor subunit [Bacillota bacterium]HOJ45883.1 efflux RND transporter periplasmic adaptor subunit [Bacillota bacterium]HPZ73023.1 efflux RND transporter periplasmic adaptor subunit [Bacillota bacterium]HQD77346.1 efflux RND transporter periplasmic adaptor subunit [Bacillota bacterium]